MPKLNDEVHFQQYPAEVGVNRSVFDLSHDWKATYNAGVLNCHLCTEVLPGDTFDIKATMLTRMTTPYFPVMDSCYIDQYLFFVPNRMLWQDQTAGGWKEFCGENNSSAWVDPTVRHIPKIDLQFATRSTGDLAHQMGITPRISTYYNTTGSYYINALPFRAYVKVWNDYFRSEALQAPIPEYLGGALSVPNSTNKLNTLLPVGRVHDMFSTAMPQPQFGDAVKIALSGWAPVVTDSAKTIASGSYSNTQLLNNSNAGTIGTAGALGVTATSVANRGGTAPSGSSGWILGNYKVDFDHPELSATPSAFAGIDVNAIRIAMQTQRVLERMALSGSRYIEWIYANFKVQSPDARQQRPELLAYSRTYVRMNEVTQSSPTLSNTTPLGTVGGHSKTIDGGLKCNKSFTEHGYLLGLFCVRHNRTYCQGIPKMFVRDELFDFYIPALQSIPNVPIYKYELDAENGVTASNKDEVWGYQEPWYDYRAMNSISSGLMDPSVTGTIGDVWTYTDKYTTRPTLSAAWIEEGSTEIARTLAVTGEDQFMSDVFWDIKATRPMPVYSIPGWNDHF